jgi:hypothetical protein
MKSIIRVSTILAMSATISCSRDIGQISPGTNTYYNGNINYGEKFGVAIGDHIPVEKPIDPSLHFVASVECNAQIDHITGCIVKEKFLLYEINGKNRKGELYLRIRGDRVASLIWQSSRGRMEF